MPDTEERPETITLELPRHEWEALLIGIRGLLAAAERTRVDTPVFTLVQARDGDA